MGHSFAQVYSQKHIFSLFQHREAFMQSKIDPRANCRCTFIQELIKAEQKEHQPKCQPFSDDHCFILAASQQHNKREESDEKSKSRLAVRKRQKNFFTKIYQIWPSLQPKHIFKLFGFKGINQKALQNPDCEQSVFYSHFESRVIQRVQIYAQALVIQMSEPTIPPASPRCNCHPINEYIVEKYKSKGDGKFYEIALMIEELNRIYKSGQLCAHSEQKPEPIKKWLDYLGDGMYACIIGSKKLAVSKSLLSYLEYEVNEFAIEAIKYRAVFHELFSSTNYVQLIKHLLKYLKYLAELNSQKISYEQFKELTTLHFNDFIYSKSKVKSYCSMSFFMLNPTFLCHKINLVYYQCDDIKPQNAHSEVRTAIKQQKDRLNFAECNTLKKLIDCPKNMLEENQKRMASYKPCEQT